MKKLILLILFVYTSLTLSAQKDYNLLAFGSGHFEVHSFGVGFQAKNRIVGNFYMANDITLFFNDEDDFMRESDVKRVINVSANLHYVFPIWKMRPDWITLTVYPLVGVGVVNYKTSEYVSYTNGIEYVLKDEEAYLKGTSVLFNMGTGITFEALGPVYTCLEYKLALGKDIAHSTILFGVGYAF